MDHEDGQVRAARNRATRRRVLRAVRLRSGAVCSGGLAGLDYGTEGRGAFEVLGSFTQAQKDLDGGKDHENGAVRAATNRADLAKTPKDFVIILKAFVIWGAGDLAKTPKIQIF